MSYLESNHNLHTFPTRIQPLSLRYTPMLHPLIKYPKLENFFKGGITQILVVGY